MSTARQLSELLPARSHTERLAIAAQDLLLADETVHTWTNGRVYRMPDASLWPDSATPMITVAPEFLENPLALQGSTEASLALLFTVFYEEPRTRLEPEDKSVDSLLHHLWRVLIATPEARCLRVPRYQNRALVQQPPTSATMRYALALTGETFEDGSPIAERRPQLQMTYRFTLDREAGQPMGFAANE